MPIAVTSVARKILSWGVRIYIAIAALVGTAVMAYPFVLVLYNGLMAPAPMPIHLPNGFKYTHDWTGTYSGLVITSGDEQHIVIAKDVKRIMWHGDTVYGYRRGHAGEVYYFICAAQQDCTDTQHYSDTEFNRLIKEKGLPEFSSRQAKSYDVLLREQSKTSVGKKGG